MCACFALLSSCSCPSPTPRPPRPHVLQYQCSGPWTTSWLPRGSCGQRRLRGSCWRQPVPWPASTWRTSDLLACGVQLLESSLWGGVRKLSSTGCPRSMSLSEVAKATQPGTVTWRQRRRSESSAACQTRIAGSLPGASSTAAVERNRSSYHPHLDEKTEANERNEGRNEGGSKG